MSCNKQNEIKNGEGFVDVKGGKIWYRVTGQGRQTPILMLHGGPGTPSYYLNPLSPLGKDRKVITFDQLGCGRSDAISDTTLMTIDNFVDQVNTLLSALQIGKVHLYGHSWGTMLGVDYYLKYPQKIKSLILASPCLSVHMWVRDADSLISTLPDSVQILSTIISMESLRILRYWLKLLTFIQIPFIQGRRRFQRIWIQPI